MNIKNTLVGMLLIMLSTTAVIQCSQGKEEETVAEETRTFKPGRGLGMGPLGLRARARAEEAAAKAKEEEAALEKGKVLPAKVKQAPPLPPKPARRIGAASAAPVSEGRVAQAEQPNETWGEMLSRHASNVATALGAD